VRLVSQAVFSRIEDVPGKMSWRIFNAQIRWPFPPTFYVQPLLPAVPPASERKIRFVGFIIQRIAACRHRTLLAVKPPKMKLQTFEIQSTMLAPGNFY